MNYASHRTNNNSSLGVLAVQNSQPSTLNTHFLLSTFYFLPPQPMTLFALHLASVLKAQPQLHIMNIQDIIDEQDAARLLEHEGDIIESLGEIHEGTRLHHDANCMAAEIRDYLQNARAQMERAGLSGVEHVSRLCDYADQLQAHHLDKLERLTRA